MVVKENTPKTFSWIGHIYAPWIFKGHHHLVFEPYGETGGNEQCKLLSYEDYKGVLAWFFLLFFRESTEQGYIQMNEDLKVKSEAIARGTRL
jgi:hypothetical protein